MTPPTAKRPKKPPQEAIDNFWAKFTTKTPGKATTVIPKNQFVSKMIKKPEQSPGSDGMGTTADATASPTVHSKTTAQASYEDAAAMCRAKVAKIVKECRRVNKKYRDPHFDLESDLKLGRRDTLQSLSNLRGRPGTPPGHDFCPRSAKRVTEIFDKPQFYIEGPTANDVRQGRDGDCWLMSALCTLSNKEGLIERLCVAHDPDVGVYGFVFHRDGEWISEIVDDFLYLTKSDYDESYTDRVLFDECERINPEEAYRKIYQSNSGALYFAQCEHPQETWLPLLEKCYAKAHGDYAAIEGGFGGEGIEDLTGGVTSEIFTTDILDKEHFWAELLMVNQEFLFGCSTGVWGGSTWGERKGIMELHSYSVQRAVEIDGKRLIRLKNPWGKGEWKGPWSDGSKEWTPQWLEKLNHRFGDDGNFWIAYEDLLRKYQAFERTRLFGPDWSVAQIWTTLNVPWMVNYHDTYFSLSISKPGPVILVLSQLDDRYFRGLEGQYGFELALRLHRAGHEDYIVRSQPPYRMRRSVNVELVLEAGDYDVRIKINACRSEHFLPIEDVIRDSAKSRREKLTRIGLAYDLAHDKGKIAESPGERAMREAHEKRELTKKREEIKKKIQSNREEEQYLKKKQYKRDKEKHRKARVRRRVKTRVAAAGRLKMAADVGDSIVTGSGLEPVDVPISKKKPAVATDIDETADKANPETPAERKSAASGELFGRENAASASTADRPSGQNPVDKNVPAGTEFPKEAHQLQLGTTSAQENKENAGDVPNRNGVEGRKCNDPAMMIPNDIPQPLTMANIEYDSGSDDMFATLSELSDRELDIKADLYLEGIRRVNACPAEVKALADEALDEFELDPWNAVAVVGLRVYHQVVFPDADEAKQGAEAKRDVVKLKVIRPNPYAISDGDEEERKSKVLDVDDSAKDATLAGGMVDRTKSKTSGNGRQPY
ncbi:hypothetical protein RJ55_01519 [Drechmeria coniospora]|nr:hypothetical protein RJ55_01519 [Drechmeria coniospora]